MKEIIYAKNIVKIYEQTTKKKQLNILKGMGTESTKNGQKKKTESTKFKALDNVSLNVNEGDFICIMGPSGSGKSTFLNILSTIDVPNTGIIKVNGHSVPTMSEKEIARFRYENIGYIFQDFNLLDALTLRENIGVPLALANVKAEEIKPRVEEIAVKLSIDHLLDKFPSECSGGQKQRVACARALISNPNIIVADEPTGNLDTKNSHELLNILKERNEKDGTAILMVTHDSMIASYSKKLIFIRDGKIDDMLERGQLSQKEFFYKIVDITSKESQSLFDEIEKTI